MLAWAALGIYCMLDSRQVFADEFNIDYHKAARKRFRNLLNSQNELSEVRNNSDDDNACDEPQRDEDVHTLDDIEIDSESINQ